MTDKRKTFLRWIGILTCVTVVTVGVTLAVCFSNERTKAKEDVGFIPLQKDGYIATPYGDVLNIKDATLQAQSLNGKTAVLHWKDKTFTVVSAYGVNYVGKTLNRVLYASLFISHDGEVIYFIDNEEFNDSQNSLWRYEVAADTIEKIDTIEHYLSKGMISPGGKYFALLEKGETATTVHLYDKEKEVQRFSADGTIELCFVTDAGTVFYNDGSGTLKSMNEDKNPVSLTEDYMFRNVLFNRDCTEMIVNCEDGCYFYKLKKDIVTEKVKLLEEGELTVFIRLLIEGKPDATITIGDRFATLDIASFRDVNLRNEKTYERVKLTANNKLVEQVGGAHMNPTLAPGDTYLYYIDENGDYFYTNTDDVNGAYHLLWEASECEGAMLIGVTAQRSVYYWDAENNIHYVKNGKDKIIFAEDAILEIAVNPFTDTIYILSDNELYYSSQGKMCRKLFDVNDTFSSGQDQIRLTYASGQVYCYDLQGDGTICKLYSDGSYQVLEPAS